MTALPPAVQAVLDVASQMVADWDPNDATAEDFGVLEWNLIVAVRALEPPTPVLPPEPEVGAVVPLGVRIATRLTARERECTNVAQRNWQLRCFGTAGEFQIRADAFNEARDIVAEECQRTVPVSSADPALVRDLAEALRACGRRLESHADASHIRLQHPGNRGLCDDLVCSADSDAIDAARALLARAEATGGGAS